MQRDGGRRDAVEQVPVLIVGGSLIGLSTAMFLSSFGVRTLVIERHRGTAIHPRAGYFQLRTLELMRSIGIERAVRDASEEQFDPDGGLNAVETLAGREIANYIPNINAGVSDLSPTVRLFMTQQKLEPILRARARELGAEMAYATELTAFEQDAGGVTATIRDIDDGAERTIRADYLIACDGNRSPIREQLGIAMQGYGLLSHSVTIYFKADCSAALRGRNLGVIYVYNPKVRGFFRLEKTGRAGFLVVFTVGDMTAPDARNVADGITDERAIELVRDAVGDPELDVTIEDVAKWRAVADVAERFIEGRVFLAGDAAHTMPPTGGYGGNTGVQDAQNLGWKLAYVVRGLAGPELLRTYDEERRPVGKLAIEQAYQRYVMRCDPDLGLDGVKPEVPDLHIEIGNRYRSSAVVADNEPDDGAPHIDPRQSKGLPGTRAPHVALERAGKHISTLDLFGRSFVLLAGPDGTAWTAAARALTERGSIEIAAYCIDGSDALANPDGTFLAAYGLAPAGAVLVRPDGYVAWRATATNGAEESTLAQVLGQILCREALARVI